MKAVRIMKLSDKISSAAAAISLISLTVTSAVYLQERENKELLIRPSLVFEFDLDALSLTLSNDGFGPAVIKNFVLREKSTCHNIDLAKKTYDQQKSFYNEMEDAMLSEMKKKSELEKFASNISIDIERNVFDPGWHLAQGKDVRMIKFIVDNNAADPASENRKVRSNRTHKDETTFERISSDALDAIADNYAIEIRYCSLTERFCENVSSSAENVCLKNGS